MESFADEMVGWVKKIMSVSKKKTVVDREQFIEHFVAIVKEGWSGAWASARPFSVRELLPVVHPCRCPRAI